LSRLDGKFRFKTLSESTMREFGKTPKKNWWQILLIFMFPSFFGNHDSEIMNFRGHNNRMESRRRKTLFDRYNR